MLVLGCECIVPFSQKYRCQSLVRNLSGVIFAAVDRVSEGGRTLENKLPSLLLGYKCKLSERSRWEGGSANGVSGEEAEIDRFDMVVSECGIFRLYRREELVLLVALSNSTVVLGGKGGGVSALRGACAYILVRRSTYSVSKQSSLRLSHRF